MHVAGIGLEAQPDVGGARVDEDGSRVRPDAHAIDVGHDGMNVQHARPVLGQRRDAEDRSGASTRRTASLLAP